MTSSKQTWTAVTDEELVITQVCEDPMWLDELFARYEGRLRSCAYRMVGPDEVEDATQEINERILRALPSFRGDSTVNTWIFAVARNTCLDIRRRRKPAAYASDVVLENISSTCQPDDLFEISILGCRTAMAIRDLPKTQAAVVVLRLGQGYSTAETAVQLGITQDAVKARLRRARERLRWDLAQEIACPQYGPGTYAIAGSGIA